LLSALFKPICEVYLGDATEVDVLSPKWMFAVDSPDPGGLTPQELAILLKTVSQSKRCAGMQITIYDPTLDRDGVCGNRIVEILVSTFA
jgi:arginase